MKTTFISRSYAKFALTLVSATIASLVLFVAAANVNAQGISNIMATSSSNGTGATITWTTDQNATSQVAYGTTTPYSTYSAIDSNLVMNHSLMLSALTPNTLYHFQVLGMDASSTATSSLDQTFMTLGTTTATTTASSTAPMISGITVSNLTGGTGATITWTTDQGASSQIQYGTSTGMYPWSTTLDSSLLSSHSVNLSGLTPSTLYYYRILSTNNSAMNTTSPEKWFITDVATTTSTTTPSTIDLSSLQAQIQQIQQQILLLIQQFNALTGGNWNWNNGSGTGTGTTTPTQTWTGFISPTNVSFPAGGSIDFGGRGFGHEEQVTVMSNGQVVTTAHADGGGNFSTGSLSLPTTAGTRTYTFTGANSGIMGSATITITQ